MGKLTATVIASLIVAAYLVAPCLAAASSDVHPKTPDEMQQAASVRRPASVSYVSLADLELTTLAGKSKSLGEIKGSKPLYVKFWASWCVSCLKQMPQLEADAKKYGERIQFVSINLGIDDSQETIQAVLDRYRLTLPTAIDSSGKLAEALGFVGTPYHILFDEDWQLVHKGHNTDRQLMGAFENLANRSAAPINEALKPGLIDPERVNSEQANSGSTQPPQNAIIFYTATWCDEYMLQARPKLALHCRQAQEKMMALHKAYPEYPIMGWVSPLWTDEQALADYIEKYTIQYPVKIDHDNQLKMRFGLNNYGIAVVIKNNKVVEYFNTLDENELETLAKRGASLKESINF